LSDAGPGASIGQIRFAIPLKDFHRKLSQIEEIKTNDLRNENFLAKTIAARLPGNRPGARAPPRGRTPYLGVEAITAIEEAKVYDEFGKFAFIAACVIVAGIALYQFTIHVLPWLLLIAAIGGAIIFYFWQRSTRRSANPWET